jgi:hypothetical protein
MVSNDGSNPARVPNATSDLGAGNPPSVAPKLVSWADMAVGAGDHQSVQHRQIDAAFGIAAEAPPGQMPTQHRRAAGFLPEVAEHQIGADAMAAQFRQFAAIEAGQYDGAAGVSGGRSDQAIEQTGVLDLVAPAKRLDDALDMAAALADVLDEVETLLAADLLDTDEPGWCPG